MSGSRSFNEYPSSWSSSVAVVPWVSGSNPVGPYKISHSVSSPFDVQEIWAEVVVIFENWTSVGTEQDGVSANLILAPKILITPSPEDFSKNNSEIDFDWFASSMVISNS